MFTSMKEMTWFYKLHEKSTAQTLWHNYAFPLAFLPKLYDYNTLLK